MTRRPRAAAGPLRRTIEAGSSNPHVQRALTVTRAVARPCWACGKYLLPLLLLTVLAVSVFYVRILYGPISLKVVAAPVARSIAAEMPGLGVSIEDALVRLNDQGELEFRLRNVRLLDEFGSPVAVAPLAAVELSLDGLWSARLSPEKVVLIEPRLLLTYSQEGGLSFSFTRPAGLAENGASSGGDVPAPVPEQLSDSGQDPGAGLPVALRQLDLARVIAEASARARQQADASSFLREIGLRNATLIFDHAGEQRIWRVPQADVALSHKAVRSLIEGSVTVDSGRGPWTLQFWSEASGETEQVSLKASVRDLIPSALADTIPVLAPLRALNMPASGDVTLQLTSLGKLLGGTFSLDLARGDLRLPWAGDLPLLFEGGSLDLRYDPEARTLRIEPSTIRWGKSRLTLAGDVASSFGPHGEEVWTYRLSGVDGRLAPEETDLDAVPVEQWRTEGTFRPKTGAFSLRQRLVAGGGELHLTADAGAEEGGDGVRLEGQMGAMPVATVLGIWPRALGRDARAWVRDSISRGQVLGGSFRFVGGSDAAGQSEAQRLSIAIQASDLQVRPGADLPPVEIPNALIRMEGSTLEITIPEASVTVANGRSIALKAGRFTAVGLFSDHPTAEIAFQGESSASALLELVEHETFGGVQLNGVQSDTIEGKVETALTITIPLRKEITFADLRVEGRGKLIDGHARGLIGNHDAQAATVAFDITDKAIDARGDLLIANVPVKLAWQHIFDAPPEKQPPFRLTATLDRTDRDQLDLDPGHLIHGEVPVEVTITKSADQEHQIHVWADLTAADLVLDNVVWRKRPGRAAVMQFDVRRDGRYELELADFKIVGDDIAISGWMGLDADEKLKEFHFPEFSANIITRLDVRGKLRDDNVWAIKARGPTYDGRDVFRALFSVGELSEERPGEERRAPGLDLEADIATVVGFSDVSLRNMKLKMSRRDGKVTALDARGILDGGKPLDVELQHARNQPRRLVALTDDAGQAFRLVDFYPSLVGGRMRLDVNLDGRGAAEKTGVLRVERFRILGDPVISEVLQVPDEGRPYVAPRRQRVVRQAFDFDWLRVPFSLGHGQFVMGDSEIRGPLVGATLRGKADFRSRQVNIGGTYVPLQGLNSAIGFIPGLGQILAGPRGEGILGITFAIRGPMAQPEVLVNPLSLVAPGIFREMFQMTPNQTVTPPRGDLQKPPSGTRSRSSGAPAKSNQNRRTGAVAPGVISGWSSETITTTK